MFILNPSGDVQPGGYFPGGSAIGDVDMAGYRVYDSTDALNLGKAAVDGHTLGSDDVLIGGKLEVDGATYFDSFTYFASDAWFADGKSVIFGNSDDVKILYSSVQTPDSALIGVGSDSRALIIAETADIATDFAFPLQTNPTLCIQSADATAPTGRIWFAHDQTNGVIQTGKGGLSMQCFNGIAYIGNAGMTQGVKFDTATIDNLLNLTTEAAGNLTVQAYAFGSTIFKSGAATALYAYSTDTSTAAASGAVSLYSGAQTNVNDWASGAVNIYTGATTTDGNTGAINIYSGAAGAGIADAGDIIFAVNGAPGVGTTMLTLDASATNSLFGAATGVGWTGRDLLKSSADGVLLITNNAGTQGLKIDTTTDGSALLAAEDGSAIRVATVMGAVTLAAAPGGTTFAATSNVMEITGTGAGSTVGTITGGIGGMMLTLIFKDALTTITDTAVGAVGANQVCLSAAFTGALGTTLTLVSNGTYWQEVCRSVNG